jgi:hypothetical protein
LSGRGRFVEWIPAWLRLLRTSLERTSKLLLEVAGVTIGGLLPRILLLEFDSPK